ncbi:MAG: LutC/YkgG family protein [Arenicella sp.]
MKQSARDAILNRLYNAAANNGQECSADSINMQAQEMLRNSPHAPLASSDPIEAFIARIANGHVIGTSCSTLSSVQELPAAVKSYLQEHKLGEDIGIQELPLFTALDWQGLNNTGPQLDGLEDGLTSLSYADFGIAETGSVVFHSGENRPVLLNFLSLHQMIVIHADNILSLLDDYAKNVDTVAPPRNTIWITGASGTTDIEGVLVQGAHGPCFVHIFII